ncbi:MAG: flagellar basal body-associated FliL family protein [Lachnospiraceae bacterium]|nr:flagellar basal body-associated FliL family protein [Lachnospiraceae bacterium]
MRKSIINIIILAVCIINVVLCGILVFAIVPAMTSTNRLVTSICELIDLELEGNKLDDNGGEIPIDKIVVHDIADEMTITLKKGSDDKPHYAIVKVSISMNSMHEDYATYSTVLPTQESLIKSKVVEIVSKYTLEQASAYTDVVEEDILEALRAMYKSEFIIDVNFRGLTFS